MPQVDPVILQLKADIDRYNADVSKAQRLTDQKLSAIEAKGLAMGQNLRKGFDLAKGAALAYAASLGVETVLRAASAGLEYASSLGEQAQQLGVTTDQLQVYRFAATQAGLSSEEMDQALSQLTRRIGEAAQGTKAQAEAFSRLGITVKDVEGNVLETGDAIPQLADALARIESPAERAALEIDLFGRAGQKLDPLLSGGSKAVNELADAAREAGAVLTPELIRNADDAADALAKVKFQLQASVAAIVAKDAAAIKQLANSLATLVGYLASASQALRDFGLAQREFAARGKVIAGLNVGVRREGLSELGQIAEERASARLSRLGLTLDKLVPGKKAPGLGAAAPAVSAPKVGGAGGGGGAGPTGPSAEETARKYEDQLASITQRILSALEQQAKSADERAEFQLRQLEFDRIQAKSEIEADKNYSKAQKADLLAANERLADRERERIEFERKLANEREANDLAEERYRGEEVALQIAFELADTQADRRRLALELLDLEERQQRAVLEAVLASETSAEADKKRAQIALDNLNRTSDAKRTATERANEGPLARYARGFGDPASDAEQLVVDEIEYFRDGIRSGIEKVTGTKDPLINGLIQMLIDQVLIRPIVEALGGLQGAAGGGGIGGIFAGIGQAFKTVFVPGRASGGPVSAGRLVRVNEGASPGRVEGFIPQDSGKIVPLGQMSALRSGGNTVVQHFHLDARGAVLTQDIVEQINQMGRDAAVAGAKGGHELAKRDIRGLQRPRL